MRKPVRRRLRKGVPVEMLEGRVFLSSSSAAQHAFAHPTYRVLGSYGNLAPDALSLVTPAQMVQAYGVNQIKFGSVTGDGSGQTIAIIDVGHDATAASDLATFDSQYGLPAPPSFKQFDQNGGTSYPAPNSNWLLEESLDIEWAHVIAPKANIILYEANSASDADLIQAAVNTARNNASVTEVSMSFGGGEFSGETSLDTYFTSNHVTFLASTGDSGSPGGYPAYSPTVVAVGGTSLTVNSSNGNWVSETAWSGSGGGTSTQEAKPSYQNGFQSTTHRTIPDVAMDADPNSGVPVYSGGSSYQVGGTSLSAPMWAGLVAIANQGRAINGLAALGSSQTLPLIYQSAASNFHDITSGSNGGFSAGPGYDEVTGRGTPIANLLIPYLAGTKPTVNTFTGSPNPVTAGANVTLTANVTDPDVAVSSVAFYRESNGTTGLQTGSGGDTLLGTGTSNGSGGWTLSTSTTGLSGAVTYYAVPTDASGVTGATATTNVTVNAGSTSSATFVKSDFSTQGTWTGVYGADGYSVLGGTTSLPAYAQLTAGPGAQPYVWAASTSDPRAPQGSAGSASRVAGCDYSASSFSFDLNLIDGRAHQVALYLVDWDTIPRTETVTVADAGSGAVLDARNAANFGGGQWLVWSLSGHVTITFANTNRVNAVVSAVMFDPAAGAASSSATFLKSDAATQGTWTGVYGADGYSVFGGGPTSLPSYARFGAEPGAQPYVWAASTSDPRAPQGSAGSASRVAGCDYSASSFALDVNLVDGKAHQVALYLLDWDAVGRNETVQVADANSGAVLDTRSVSNFQGGVWLAWNVTGSVRITITNTGGPNAVASGIFFG